MLTAQSAIAKTRRDLTVALLLRWGLLVACGAALIGQHWLADAGLTATAVISVAVAGWLILGFQSMRGSRIAADSTLLIANGQYDRAEEQLEEAIDSFSIFRGGKLTILHHLAVLRHAQSRWQDAAALSQMLVLQGRQTGSLDRSSRLILAESLLQLNDLNGAEENLSNLYRQRLSLREALQWLSLQLSYQARMGHWAAMLDGVATKVQLVELLPTNPAAIAQGHLALAAMKLGKTELSQWLAARALLLMDSASLCKMDPLLAMLWPQPTVEAEHGA